MVPYNEVTSMRPSGRKAAEVGTNNPSISSSCWNGGCCATPLGRNAPQNRVTRRTRRDISWSTGERQCVGPLERHSGENVRLSQRHPFGGAKVPGSTAGSHDQGHLRIHLKT